uniref:tRNA (adenine(37)-N6)-methyltransferase n=1 Tax=Geotrypetes seraphini TaxID=260995 RepID=A0A6P8N9S1_GEOSA|nr:tRNA (adenine(37)-N6)-methyltransferase isoform X2 [Geotrypetes seraphini]XP_033772412.1 tRNA (adenine(37)-N6)-methyltransferase isoform X2 [Geotrypetes seraphini]
MHSPKRSPVPWSECCARSSLESGNIVTIPVGYIDSCFSAKNGTPRQPSVCRLSRARLTINKSVFNNPEHCLMGLEQFSHIWILFIFHKNGHLSCKAKVQPPRLNGAKTGVFSTRSPHRPNAIGLTLAKLEKIEGGTIYLSGIDMIRGTPVLDIKPYILEYDSPQNADLSANTYNEQGGKLESKYSQELVNVADNWEAPNNLQSSKAWPCQNQDPFYASDSPVSKNNQDKCLGHENSSKTKLGKAECIVQRVDITSTMNESKRSQPVAVTDTYLSQDTGSTTEGGSSMSIQHEQCSEFQPLQEQHQPAGDNFTLSSSVPPWIKNSSVATLQVRFTPHSEMEINQFKAAGSADAAKSFRYCRSPEEMKHVIITILAADPRSVYRRKQCQDRLFYFTVDTAHITCWFSEGFAEVLQVKPLEAS